MPSRTAPAPTIPRKTAAAKPAKPVATAAKPGAPAPSPAPAARKAPVGRPVGGALKSAGKAALPMAKVALPVAKGVKLKLVRDGFTMPEADHGLIAVLKKRGLGFERPTKKSELLRAGLQALAALDDKRLKAALEALVPIKTGRPKKH